MAIEYQSNVKRRYAGVRFTKIAASVVLKFAAMTYQVCRAAMLLVLLSVAGGVMQARPTLIDLLTEKAWVGLRRAGSERSKRIFGVGLAGFGRLWPDNAIARARLRSAK